MFSRSSTQYVSGMSDSPMWKRGKRSRSNSSTRRPCCASSVETVDPAGPPPMTTTSGFVSMVYLETLGDFAWDVDRFQRLGVLPHADDRHRAGRDVRVALLQRARVRDRLLRQRRDAQQDVELVLEAQRAMELERGRDARPPDVGVRRMNAQAGFAPERVLGFLHVAEEPAEMDDARDVGLVELHTAAQVILAQWHSDRS